MSKLLFAFAFVLLAAFAAAQPTFLTGSQTVCQANNATIAFNSTNTVVSVQSLNTTVVQNSNTTLTFVTTATGGTFFVQPTGYGFVQINVTDNAGLSTLFNLTVTRANIPPTVTFTSVTFPDQSQYPTVLTNNAQYNPVEAGQTILSAAVTAVSNPSLFSSLPTIDLTGTITFTLANGASGSSTQTVVVRDSGGSVCGSDTTTTSFIVFTDLSTTPSATPKKTKKKTPKPRTPRPNPPPPPPRRSPSPSESGVLELRSVFSAMF